jgi:hypothetical protein
MPQVTTWTRFVNQAALDAHLETLGDGTYVRRHFNRDENPARIEFQPGRLIRTEHTVNDELKAMWQFMLMDEPNNIQPFVVTDRRTPKTCHFVDVTAAPNDDPHAGEHRTARRRSETRAAEEDELVGFSEDAVAAAVRAVRERRARAAAPPAAVAQAAAPIAIDAAEHQVPGQARRPRQEDADMYHQIDERRRLDDVRREAATLLAGVPQPPHGHTMSELERDAQSYLEHCATSRFNVYEAPHMKVARDEYNVRRDTRCHFCVMVNMVVIMPREAELELFCPFQLFFEEYAGTWKIRTDLNGTPRQRCQTSSTSTRWSTRFRKRPPKRRSRRSRSPNSRTCWHLTCSEACRIPRRGGR